MGRLSWMAGAALALSLAAGAAQAAVIDLTLTVDATAGIANSFIVGNKSYTQTYYVASDASGPLAPFDINTGDTLNVTLTVLNGPASTGVHQEVFVGLDFVSFDPGQETTGDLTHESLLNGLISFSGSCCLSAIYGAPANTGVDITSFTTQATVSGLTGPFRVDEVRLSHQVADTAVPEPGAWALMITGFGAAGAALRRRRPRRASHA